MNFKITFILILFLILSKIFNLEYNSNFENYSNKGFALIYEENFIKIRL